MVGARGRAEKGPRGPLKSYKRGVRPDDTPCIPLRRDPRVTYVDPQCGLRDLSPCDLCPEYCPGGGGTVTLATEGLFPNVPPNRCTL